jgi:hypothetical protein
MGRSFTGSVTKEQFKISSMYLRASLAYFEPESEFELRSGDGVEEFIFAVYEIEKKKSGIDYLNLEEGGSGSNANTYGETEEGESFGRTSRRSGKVNSSKFEKFQRFRDSGSDHEDFVDSKGFETLWTVAEVSNDGGDSDSID